jgi:hypothetical protein
MAMVRSALCSGPGNAEKGVAGEQQSTMTALRRRRHVTSTGTAAATLAFLTIPVQTQCKKGILDCVKFRSGQLWLRNKIPVGVGI